MSDILPSLFPRAISDHSIIIIAIITIYTNLLQINTEYIIKPGSVESMKGCSVIMKRYVTPCTGSYDILLYFLIW